MVLNNTYEAFLNNITFNLNGHGAKKVGKRVLGKEKY